MGAIVVPTDAVAVTPPPPGREVNRNPAALVPVNENCCAAEFVHAAIAREVPVTVRQFPVASSTRATYPGPRSCTRKLCPAPPQVAAETAEPLTDTHCPVLTTR